MSNDISPADVARHNELVDEAWALEKGQTFLHGSGPSGKPGIFARRRLQKAIKCFQEALEINPEGWESMWALGKIYQRFGKEAETLFWFKKAIALAPDQPDVARETGLAAFAVGDMELGFKCTQAALDARPDDPGLIANLAFAHLLHGDLTEAQSLVRKALQLAPDDTISQYLARVIRGVVEGTQPRPTSIHDVA